MISAQQALICLDEGYRIEITYEDPPSKLYLTYRFNRKTSNNKIIGYYCSEFISSIGDALMLWGENYEKNHIENILGSSIYTSNTGVNYTKIKMIPGINIEDDLPDHLQTEDKLNEKQKELSDFLKSKHFIVP
jgi:hypothetical protein